MTIGAERSHPSWHARRTRALALKAERRHAADLLGGYLGVLDQQERLYAISRDGHWPDLRNAEGDARPMLRLERLPYESLARTFGEFVRELRQVMPDTLAPAVATLDAAHVGLSADLLRDAAARRPLSLRAESLRTDAATLEFFCRAFLQPIAEALAHSYAEPTSKRTDATCPLCGWPPQFALLQDEPEVQGRRSLVCALCSVEWTFARSVCVNCREDEAERLDYHVADSVPHVRIEACTSCRTYLKIIDLRAEGTLAPVVDEIASVELDLWCDEQGLTKLQRNLLGM